MDALISPLIEALRHAIPMVVRVASDSGDYLEGVFSRGDLPRAEALLRKTLGPPIKEFGATASFERTTQDLVNRVGGIRIEQCPFFQQRQSPPIAYAALWPWASDTTRITLKVGVIF